MTPRSRRADRDAVALDATLAREWPLPLSDDADKHTRGTVLVIGGAVETPGAVVLAGIAALRMGAGRLQIATVAEAAASVAVAVPESMVLSMSDGELDEHVARAGAVVVGPGLRAVDPTELVDRVLRRAKDEAIVVLDALALQALDRVDRDLLDQVGGRLVLTPNREEVARLGGDDLVALAESTGAVVTSFGSVAAPDGRQWVSAASTPGLGTSGSGDVLAGLIGGAAARSGDAAHAAVWGTYAHAAAGARLSARMGRVGFIARELLDEVPRLWHDLGS
jgi:hydroxyethylthiazole kinase-like uncharacterized protein yjeF